MKILHVITGLNAGGAELMLDRLVRALKKKDVDSAVCTLSGIGQVGESLREQGIEVYNVDMRRSPLSTIPRLRKIIKSVRPDIVHTWLYHADLLGGIAARTVKNVHLIWSLRNSRLNNKFLTNIAAGLCVLLSGKLPGVIVACAESAKQEHVEKGYPGERIEVIPNGFDTTRFYPNPTKGREIRREIGVGADALAFGLVGRYDPHKDHEGFIAAISEYTAAHPRSNAKFIFCGSQMNKNNKAIAAAIRSRNLQNTIRLIGAHSNIEDYYQAFDVVVSSSISEGFSNVIGEAMACGKPCIVTDVGDSRSLLAGAGIVVPPGDPLQMSAAIADMVSMKPTERDRLGLMGRRTIEEKYSLHSVVDRYIELYRSELTKCAA